MSIDIHAHNLHMGIMWEERQRAKESKQTLFTNCYPLVEMGWTQAECYTYNKDNWGLATRASCCLFCPFHTNYFYQHIREHKPACYACALQVDELVETHQARPPLKNRLFLSKSRKRLRDLTDQDCEDMQTFLYCGRPVWNGFWECRIMYLKFEGSLSRTLWKCAAYFICQTCLKIEVCLFDYFIENPIHDSDERG